MTQRLNIFKVAPDAVKAMIGVETAIANSGLDHTLLDLLKVRASQINGCAFCVHMHVNEALKHGESHMRLHMVATWRESSMFNDRERAVLAWTETLTNIAQTGAPEADFALLKSQFSDNEIGNLTMAIGAINLWNRVQVGFRAAHPVETPITSAA